MRPGVRIGLGLLLAALLGAAAGCGDDSPAKPGGGDAPAPDFSVRDVNPDSPRYDAMVSPRDYVGRVSAWYFGHST